MTLMMPLSTKINLIMQQQALGRRVRVAAVLAVPGRTPVTSSETRIPSGWMSSLQIA
jgi:hypothetical protein